MKPMSYGLVSVSEFGDTLVNLFIVFMAMAGVTAVIAMWAFFQFLKKQRKK